MRKIWIDILNGENIDLYVTVAVAVPLAILTIFDIASPAITSSMTLAILALIAVSLLVNRNKLDNVGDQKKLWNAGIVNVHDHLGKSDFRERITSAKQYVRYLGTMMENNVIFEDSIVPAAKNGCKVQILLLEPDSKTATERSLQLGLHKDHIKIKAASRIKELFTLAAKNGINFEIRVYDAAIPAIHTVICDEYALVGFYWRQNRSTESPMLEIHGVHTTSIGRLIEKEFLVIWESARIINLESQL